MTTGGCNVLDLPAALPPSLCVLAPPAHGPEPHAAPDPHPDPHPGQVLDRLLDGTGHIVAADLNAAQNALLELKLAGLRALTYEQFFQLFAQVDT